ncbi:hypothetical protein [Paraferrimonas sedimenticola]|uniref:Lipoprotein n=1 Tax=Paraferrimonas sedimenticola TaxID=375674 RepID=A0AA37VWM1_9GAMM|nr:hypothetical protein [Paraferrimonas sedimenticola]GLP94900.1 hypothetical protein GCM10007895_02060 [Paraferrimonas sedimenticola]
MKSSFILVSIAILSGCSSIPDYEFTDSVVTVRALQTLDPQAPEVNDGITREIEGNYGKQVMTNYQASSMPPESGRSISSSSSSGSGSN